MMKLTILSEIVRRVMTAPTFIASTIGLGLLGLGATAWADGVYKVCTPNSPAFTVTGNWNSCFATQNPNQTCYQDYKPSGSSCKGTGGSQPCVDGQTSAPTYRDTYVCFARRCDIGTVTTTVTGITDVPSC